MKEQTVSQYSEDYDVRWSELKETLRQSQNLAVAGQFAATVMHEINNPLEAISNLTYLLQGVTDDAPMVRQYCQLIEEQLAILIRISRQTLSYFRPGEEKVRVAAATLAEAALRIHQRNIASKRLQISVAIERSVTLEVHAGEMLQVMSNLVANAVDALPAHGRLVVRCRESNEGVHLLIADNGHGIPATIATKIFDPFFTTKQDRGTGLGLALSKSIVEKHHGRIRSRSSTRSGRSGTTFRITLPRPTPIAVSR